MKPYDASQPVFMQQFGNRTTIDYKGREIPVHVYYNLDEHGKHPLTGEEVPAKYTSPGQILVAGKPSTEVIEASGVLYGFSVGLGGYVALNSSGEFPGIVSRTDKEPGALPNLQDVLQVVTNWYPTTPVKKQGISISFAKDNGMVTPETHLVLSRDVELGNTVALIYRQQIATDDIPHAPEVLLTRLNVNSPADTHTTFIEAAFDVINSAFDTQAQYYLGGVYREIRVVESATGFEFLLVRTVKAANTDANAINSFEHIKRLARCDHDLNFVIDPDFDAVGHSMYALVAQLESLVEQKVGVYEKVF